MKTISTILCLCLFLCTGCAFGSSVSTHRTQSNLAAFLFGGTAPSAPAQKAPLTLPAKVGVTFVPDDPALAAVPDTVKKEVVESVRSQLAKHTRYVAGAQAIPSLYLLPKGGVNNLEQVARQFDVDVIVVLGASQFQKHERNSLAAFLDLTLIGSFVIPGTTVDTDTVLEAAVYHVPSRALIFRADGADQTTSRATDYGSAKAAHNDAVAGIDNASKKLVAAIGESLAGFEKFDAAHAPEIKPFIGASSSRGNGQANYWNQVSSYRTTGGGAMDPVWIFIAGGLLACVARNRKR